MQLTDSFGRIHDYVRISLIDKCNLNCIYCNPTNSPISFESNRSILSYEELYRLINILLKNLEIKKIRFTGGEPLIRKDIMKFFQRISLLKNKYDFEIGITTNGTKLIEKLEPLHQFGVELVNISLDTLNRNNFIAITGTAYFDETLAAIHKAMSISFKSVKVNSVIMKNINHCELNSFINYFKDYPITLRFIEYMPFTGNQWDDSKFFSWQEMKTEIDNKYLLTELSGDGKVSKDYFVEGKSLKIGFISSISNHFCDSCSRLRFTASGKIKDCLFSSASDVSLKTYLADNSISDENIAEIIKNSLQKKWFKHPDVEELIYLKQNNMMSIGG